LNRCLTFHAPSLVRIAGELTCGTSVSHGCQIPSLRVLTRSRWMRREAWRRGEGADGTASLRPREWPEQSLSSAMSARGACHGARAPRGRDRGPCVGSRPNNRSYALSSHAPDCRESRVDTFVAGRSHCQQTTASADQIHRQRPMPLAQRLRPSPHGHDDRGVGSEVQQDPDAAPGNARTGAAFQQSLLRIGQNVAVAARTLRARH
jgi:hypothetical protein